MPILKKWQLIEFRKYTQSIKPPKGNPILNYICITPEGKLVKTDLEITCSMGVDFALKQLEMFGATSDKTRKIAQKIIGADFSIETNLLVDEKILYALVNPSDSDFIYIWRDKEDINISDGKSLTVHPYEESNLFPNMPKFEGQVDVLINKDVITGIQTARKFTQSDNKSEFCAVHLLGNYIMAYNFHSMFFKQLNDIELPNMILIDKFSNAISQFEFIDFYSGPNHYFFSSKEKNILYTFTKTQYKTPNLIDQISIIKQKTEEAEYKFFMSKDDILKFCEHVSASTDKTVTPCTLSKNKTLVFSGNDACKEITRDIYIEGNVSEFNFNSKLVQPGFEAIRDSKLFCIIISNMLIIQVKEENCLTVVCFVGGQKQNEQ